MSIRKYFPTAAAVFAAMLLTISAGTASAAGISWRSSLQAAAEESGRTGKPLLLKFTASWCGYCRKMKAETFSDPRIVEHVSDCFIPIEVDADKNPQLMQAVGVKGLPTTVIVSPELKVVRKLTGYQNADQLDQHLTQVCPATHRRSADSAPAVTQAGATSAQPVPGNTGRPAPFPQDPAPQAAAPQETAPVDFSFAGRCLVSLVDGQKLAQGDPRFSIDWRHRKVCFASRTEMQTFLQNPDRYWPQLSGGCPVTAVDENALVDGQPELGVLFRGKIWFFRSEADLVRFEQNPARYVDGAMKMQQR